MLKIRVYTAYWTPEDVEHGANDPDKTTVDVHHFDDADEAIEWLQREGLTEPSQYPVSDPMRTWLTDADIYQHPYTAVLEKRTAHPMAATKFADWTRIINVITK